MNAGLNAGFEYFLLTVTLPAEFRALAWAHQAVVYDSLIRCSWETVRTFSLNDRQLQCTPGAIAVLHTNTRRLDYHPHVHLVMPAAALDGARKRWGAKRPAKGKAAYLFNQKALARVFRAKMLAAFAAAGPSLPARHPQKWVVNCKSVGNGEKALVYLGRYLYRGVISENDIVACADGQVSFRYRDGKSGKTERRTVSGANFLWLVLHACAAQGVYAEFYFMRTGQWSESVHSGFAALTTAHNQASSSNIISLSGARNRHRLREGGTTDFTASRVKPNDAQTASGRTHRALSSSGLALRPTQKSAGSPQMTTRCVVAISVANELARELIAVGAGRSAAEFVEREWRLEVRG